MYMTLNGNYTSTGEIIFMVEEPRVYYVPTHTFKVCNICANVHKTYFYLNSIRCHSVKILVQVCCFPEDPFHMTK